MNINSARLLVFHGSRNQQYSVTVSRLANLVRERFARQFLTEYHLQQQKTSYSKIQTNIKYSPLAQLETITTATVSSQNLIPLVDVAVLEFADVPLAQSIVSFAQKAIALNYQQVEIVPIFLAAGIHVRADIPEEIAQAQQQLERSIELKLLDYLGNSPQLTALIAQQLTQMAAQERILLAHGSRLSQGNVAIERLARQVKGVNAYWTVQPDLTSVVQVLVNQNKSSIAIVPYFLFSGKITEAIALQVAELQNKFPQTKLLLGKPFGATPKLAEVICAHILQQN